MHSPLDDLAQRNAATLGEQLAAVNEASSKVRVMPGASQLESWITQAKTLPQAVTH
jgi:hypothetical protein